MALEQEKRNKLATLSAALIGAFVLSLAFYLFTPLKESFQKPDYNEIKRHILTEAVLQKLEEIRKQQQNEYMSKFLCSLNPVNQINGYNPCPKDLTNKEALAISESDIFELWLLRHCELTKTVREAKELGCLPR